MPFLQPFYYFTTYFKPAVEAAVEWKAAVEKSATEITETFLNADDNLLCRFIFTFKIILKLLYLSL